MSHKGHTSSNLHFMLIKNTRVPYAFEEINTWVMDHATFALRLSVRCVWKRKDAVHGLWRHGMDEKR